jgi:cytochrome c oxidase cbb3-type subunit 3
MIRGRMLMWMTVVAGAVAIGDMGSPVHAASAGQAVGADDAGAKVYAARCSMCHQPTRAGLPPTFPSLIGIGKKYTEPQIAEIVHNGKGKMPKPLPELSDADVTALTHFLIADPAASTAMPPAAATRRSAAAASGQAHGVDTGGALFRTNCAFCHGRDTMGGESGPDLTRSKLVLGDVAGDKIGEVIKTGRQNTEKKMPAFPFSDQEILDVSAFIHSQVEKAAASAKKPGGRKGVDVADLQTGNLEAGKAYFNGAGTCSKCHSGTGDLAHVASKYQGLQLEMQMLYPRNAKFKGTVTTKAGEKVTGIVAYKDEFVVGLKTADGTYRSWNLDKVTYVEDAPVKMHAELFPKYTDKDIHDLMAYIQTLK